MVELSEPINVWVYFKGSVIYPFQFSWHGRSIKVDDVNLVHTSKQGATVFYHFSISSSGNFYELKFDSKNLKWFLAALEEER